MRKHPISSRLGHALTEHRQAAGPTDQALRLALGDDHLMRKIRLACSDVLRIEHLSNHTIIQYYLKLQDGCRLSDGFGGSGASTTAAGRSAITQKQLKRLFPKAGDEYLQQVAGELNRNLTKYGLGSPLRKAHFFAQLREESGPGLEATVESLSYSPDGLHLFLYYKLHKKEAEEDGYERDPRTRRITRAARQQDIANKAYAGRNGNGNAESGDGWNFRGRGLIQVTGRSTYSQITQQYAALYVEDIANTSNYISFVAKPDLVGDFPYSLRSAVCYWAQHKLHLLADRGHTDDDVDRITRVINKHTKSYKARCEHFKSAYSVFK
ncbi:hypothetical protein OPKNFCMD_5158 [Methylobacterium crusticola]|uniref:Glycoside hydrolase family 19 protein n=1 Tax=Methylobacterium crusticola TaxID=1697972 RepID=A0ABQ4R425_9HYPH|nr:hypothetical protein [Methylobacterium crusticola]GJD52393.1 hypothetical protein OPKNFCMD_5158 [Methylobacterium crusticola]